MNLKRWLLCLPFLLIPILPNPAWSNEELEGLTITRVTVEGNRTDRSVFEEEIRVREGGLWRKEDVDQTRKNLNEMRLFKRVEIESQKTREPEGVEVRITLEDGWFILPIPMAWRGSGGTVGSLMVLERNLFRKAESFYFFGALSPESHSVMVGSRVGRYSANAMFFGSKYTETVWKDGGQTAASLFRAKADDDDSEFGTVVNTYERRVDGGSGGFDLRIRRGFHAGLSVSMHHVDYREPLVDIPSDAGDQNALGANLRFGKDSRRGGEGFVDSFGALFGLGLSDLDERVAPLPEPEITWRGDVSSSHGTRSLGSDFTYDRFLGGAGAELEFRNRHKLSVGVRAGTGADLPLTQKVGTGRMLGLRGNYAREYRGNSGVGGSLSFAAVLLRNRMGTLVCQTFVEGATVWRGGEAFSKSGVGGNFYYRFWRFPLPLGIGYTYSMDDGNSQLSMAIGGML